MELLITLKLIDIPNIRLSITFFEEDTTFTRNKQISSAKNDKSNEVKNGAVQLAMQVM